MFHPHWNIDRDLLSVVVTQAKFRSSVIYMLAVIVQWVVLPAWTLELTIDQIRVIRNYNKLYDLENTSHFIITHFCFGSAVLRGSEWGLFLLDSLHCIKDLYQEEAWDCDLKLPWQLSGESIGNVSFDTIKLNELVKTNKYNSSSYFKTLWYDQQFDLLYKLTQFQLCLVYNLYC